MVEGRKLSSAVGVDGHHKDDEVIMNKSLREAEKNKFLGSQTDEWRDFIENGANLERVKFVDLPEDIQQAVLTGKILQIDVSYSTFTEGFNCEPGEYSESDHANYTVYIEPVNDEEYVAVKVINVLEDGDNAPWSTGEDNYSYVTSCDGKTTEMALKYAGISSDKHLPKDSEFSLKSNDGDHEEETKVKVKIKISTPRIVGDRRRPDRVFKIGPDGENQVLKSGGVDERGNILVVE